MAASSTALRARRRAAARRARFWSRVVVAGVAGGVVVVGIGLAFAGPAGRLAAGTTIDGVPVGGLTPAAAERLLERRAAALRDVPVTFEAAQGRFRFTPRALGVQVDWAAAVAEAQTRGGGFGVLRGYRRLTLRLFGTNVAPHAATYRAGVDYEVGKIAAAVGSPHRNARLVRHGLHVDVVGGTTGLALDRSAATAAVVRALASFSRAPVRLPVRVVAPSVTAAALAAPLAAARRVIAAPVTLVVGPTRLRVPRWRLATILRLPAAPGASPSFAGAAADAWFARLVRAVDRSPRDATWAVGAGGVVRVVAAAPGLQLDPAAARSAVLAAALRPASRIATLPVAVRQPQRTTAQAEAMKITGTVATYETFYGGVPNRIHNVELVARLINGALIAPGATFSFNGTTGARTAAKGFLEAPVIINGEVQTGLGGGVCQVSTTVFNAAFDAGLPITARTNHALYISHYPLGRDATVDYPDIDLKFVNDTGQWMLLRTFVGPTSLTVGLYGTPVHRRVVAITAPLKVVSPAPVQRVVDRSLAPGTSVVEQDGVPATSTSVERKVYSASGKLLSDATWYSNYVAQPEILQVGPKKKKKTQPAAGKQPAVNPPPTQTTTKFGGVR